MTKAVSSLYSDGLNPLFPESPFEIGIIEGEGYLQIIFQYKEGPERISEYVPWVGKDAELSPDAIKLIKWGLVD